MRRAGASAVVLIALLAGGCAAKTDPKVIADICIQFSRAPHGDLLTEDRKATLLRWSDGGGVPERLRSAVATYYEGEALGGAVENRRGRLERHRQDVLKQCHENGWSE